MKFLGILLDKNLNFRSHCDLVYTKLIKALYALRRASTILDTDNLKTLYSALFLPYINYGILAWGGTCKRASKYLILHQGNTNNNMAHLSKIHLLQKSAFRIIAKTHYQAHHIPLCYQLELLDLPELYSIKALSFLHQYIHGYLPPSLSNIISFYYSRNDELLIKTQYCRTNIASSTIIHTLPNIWNPLPKDLKIAIFQSKATFYSKIKTYFFSTYSIWKCQTKNCYSCKYENNPISYIL